MDTIQDDWELNVNSPGKGTVDVYPLAHLISRSCGSVPLELVLLVSQLRRFGDVGELRTLGQLRLMTGRSSSLLLSVGNSETSCSLPQPVPGGESQTPAALKEVTDSAVKPPPAFLPPCPILYTPSLLLPAIISQLNFLNPGPHHRLCFQKKTQTKTLTHSEKFEGYS